MIIIYIRYIKDIFTFEYQNSLIIDGFTEPAIDQILTNEKIPETLTGAALSV